MPYINKPKKKQEKHGKSGDIHKLYNTKKWAKMRENCLMTNPLCQICGEKIAEEVHHIKPISTGNNINEMAALAFDYDNIISVCHNCHINAHKALGKWSK